MMLLGTRGAASYILVALVAALWERRECGSTRGDEAGRPPIQ